MANTSEIFSWMAIAIEFENAMANLIRIINQLFEDAMATMGVAGI